MSNDRLKTVVRGVTREGGGAEEYALNYNKYGLSVRNLRPYRDRGEDAVVCARARARALSLSLSLSHTQIEIEAKMVWSVSVFEFFLRLRRVSVSVSVSVSVYLWVRVFFPPFFSSLSVSLFFFVLQLGSSHFSSCQHFLLCVGLFFC